MGNRVQRSTGEPMETGVQWVASCTSASPDQTSLTKSHTAFEERSFSLHEVVCRDPTGARSSSSTGRRSEYFSARTEAMMHTTGQQFSSDAEREIAHSKVHWSELSAPAALDDDEDDEEKVVRENWKVFHELMNDPQWRHPISGARFFEDFRHVQLGEKIAEGGQAEIFEILQECDNVCSFSVFKVFKRDARLSQLRQQWPLRVLRKEVYPLIRAGTMLSDGRFAFVIRKCWGDLRKLIDQAMQEKNNQGPPFPYELTTSYLGGILPIRTFHAQDIMRDIAYWMSEVHAKDVVHRDLKTSNILLSPSFMTTSVLVADFECSIGVVGTKFWRAPELLLALKNGDDIVFTEKMDVYSYGMTCFEIVTGRLPFEGELEPSRASYDLVIEGQRPILPSDLDVRLKDLIQKCWSPNPTKRPTFFQIMTLFQKIDGREFHEIMPM